jgi:PIN domain nuclease of toxin-antitoxin system
MMDIEIEKTNDENEEINLQDIISIINPTEEDQNQEEIIEESPPVTNKEALSAIKTLDIYIEQQSEKLQLSENEFKLLKSLKRKIKKIDFDSYQQTTLDSFLDT